MFTIRFIDLEIRIAICLSRGLPDLESENCHRLLCYRNHVLTANSLNTVISQLSYRRQLYSYD